MQAIATRIAVVMSVSIAVVSAEKPARAENYNPRVGVRHADFTLPTIADSRPMSLDQFRGKKLLLIQFASW